ncbi:MAG: adenine phosphoribosyltransferase [Peptostreptococcales bacterium]|jgi:adenine phosphoribosyltransferase
MTTRLQEKIRDVENFPKEGVLFRDITPLLHDGQCFSESIEAFKALCADLDFDFIVGPESRGFIFGTPLAYALKKGFIPVRKPGKLPCETVTFEYDLEYGCDRLEMHKDAIKAGDKVVIVDDLLATGGTIASAVQLIEQLGGEVVGIFVLIELMELKGKDKLTDYVVRSILQY